VQDLHIILIMRSVMYILACYVITHQLHLILDFLCLSEMKLRITCLTGTCTCTCTGTVLINHDNYLKTTCKQWSKLS